MEASETFSLLEQFSQKQRRKLHKYEQHDRLHNDFMNIARELKLIQASVLIPFFNIDQTPFVGGRAYMPIGGDHLYIDHFHLLTIDNSYLLVGIEIHEDNDGFCQSRFLVELGYTARGIGGKSAYKHYEVLNSIEELVNLVNKFKEHNYLLGLVWEMDWVE